MREASEIVRRMEPHSARPWRLVALLSAAVAMLAACETVTPEPPGPPPGMSWAEQTVTAPASVSGLSITVSYDRSKARLRGFSGVSAGEAAVVHDDEAGRAVVSWIAQEPQDGPVLTLHWAATEDAPRPTVAATLGFRTDGSQTVGATLGELRPSGAGQPVSTHSALDPLQGEGGAPAACLRAEYDRSLASYPLGDIDASGQVDVEDVVLLHDAILEGDIAGTPHLLFHADMTGDCAYDEADVMLLLEKAGLPDAPARPVAKPPRLTYLQLVAGTPVLVVNAGNAPLASPSFAGVNVNGSSFSGAFEWLVEGRSGEWQLSSAPNDALGTLTVSVGEAETTIAVGNVAVLIAGQSNAVGFDPAIPSELTTSAGFQDVRTLANDYRWKPATEPLDNPVNQVDCVSRDSAPGTSLGTQLGRLLSYGGEGVAETGRMSYLIPAALGASRIGPHQRSGNCMETIGWNLGPSALAGTDRDTLFGSAVYRALVSAGERDNPTGEASEGGPVSAVYWYQGESDNSTQELRGAYSQLTEEVFVAFQDQIAASSAAVEPVVIYAQLAPYGCCEGGESAVTARAEDLMSHDIAERQRRFEEHAHRGQAKLDPDTGLSGGVPGAHMVVTHDLPRSDRVHVSAEAQLVLAERVALAYQEHVLGWDVDGTGPRIHGLTRSGLVITLTMDRDVDQTAAPGPDGYSRYFTAFWGAPTGSNYSSYGGNEIAIADVRRHATDPRKVVVTLAAPGGDVQYSNVYLRYKRPHSATETSDFIQDVIRGSDSGLPLPSFGPLWAG